MITDIVNDTIETNIKIKNIKNYSFILNVIIISIIIVTVYFVFSDKDVKVMLDIARNDVGSYGKFTVANTNAKFGKRFYFFGSKVIRFSGSGVSGKLNLESGVFDANIFSEKGLVIISYITSIDVLSNVEYSFKGEIIKGVINTNTNRIVFHIEGDYFSN